MSYSIITMPSFDNELLDISDYISNNNPLNAKKFTRKILENIYKSLSFLPWMFRVYNWNVRFFPYWNYLIFYEVIEKEKKVLLLHIIHWARDLSKLNF